MKREIRLSKRAMQKLDSLLVYLEEEWSTKVKYEFVQKLDKSLKQIQKLPDSFPESEKIRGLRKCVVTKQTTVFYRYSEATIDVVTIFDNRKNPKSLKKKRKSKPRFTTGAKFHLGSESETKVVRTLVSALARDKETVLCLLVRLRLYLSQSFISRLHLRHSKITNRPVFLVGLWLYEGRVNGVR